DVAADSWRAAGQTLDLLRYTWLTAASSEKHGAVFLVAFGEQRRTYALRYDPKGPGVEREGAPPGTVSWKRPEQKLSLEDAPAPDVQAHARFLRELPTNRFVNAEPSGLVVSKTWSTAIATTDTGEVIYTGGGHSGYSGNDIAHYDIAANRWSLSWPPHFPPFLEGANGSPWGYAYGCRPWSQHTYLWYAYDPVSKMVLYCARPTIHDGVELALDPADPTNTFTYDSDEHRYWAWVYDPATRTMHPPSFGRPFPQAWHLALCTTPEGVYACHRGVLYKATINAGKITWAVVDENAPSTAGKRDYHYEYQPLLYDSKRDRLIHLLGRYGDEAVVEVHTRPLVDGGTWSKLPTTGHAEIAREVVYLPKQDSILALLGREQVYVLDCATNRWRQLDVELPEGRYGHECALVYDPVHDVAVALVPSRFSGPLLTLLFRYDPGTATYRDAPPAGR
ncbi:MAG: hypothetical protein ACE5JM_16490, partial [Armatimonadota bacterium]